MILRYRNNKLFLKKWSHYFGIICKIFVIYKIVNQSIKILLSIQTLIATIKKNVNNYNKE